MNEEEEEEENEQISIDFSKKLQQWQQYLSLLVQKTSTSELGVVSLSFIRSKALIP